MKAILKHTRPLALLVFFLGLIGPALAGTGSLNFQGTPGSGYVREATGIVSPSPLDISGSFTLEAWINPSSIDERPILSDSAYLLSTFPVPNSSVFGIKFILFYTNSNNDIIGSVTTWPVQLTGLAIGTLNHVVAMFDGVNNRCFLAINGVLTVTPAGTACTSGPLLTGSNQLFGVGITFAGNSAGNNPGPERFNGSITEIRISTSQRYIANFTPATTFTSDPFTAGLWHINEAPGSTTFADSGPGNHTLFAVADTTPDAFSFNAQTGIPFGNAAVSSNPITVSGINFGAPVSIVGGSYSVNGGAFTAAPGAVNNGDSVRVRVNSSGSINTQTCTTLTIGGVSGPFCATTGTPVLDLTLLLPLLLDDD